VGVIGKNLFDDIAAEIWRGGGCNATCRLGVYVEIQVRCHGLIIFFLGDDFVAQHGVQNRIAALLCLLGMLLRIVAVGVLHKPGEGGGLLKVQLGGRDAPVVLGCSLNAIVAVTEKGQVKEAF